MHYLVEHTACLQECPLTSQPPAHLLYSYPMLCCCGGGGCALKPECRRHATHCATGFCLPNTHAVCVQPRPLHAQLACLTAISSLVRAYTLARRPNRFYLQHIFSAHGQILLPPSLSPAALLRVTVNNVPRMPRSPRRSVTAALALPPLLPPPHHSLSAGGGRGVWAAVRWGWCGERAEVK